MNYFRHFPTVTYTFDGGSTQITNFTERAKIQERIRTNITVFYDYVIQDGMRPDSVSQALYGSPNYTWIILLVNNIFSLYDWPLNSEEFAAYIVEKYGSLAKAQACLVYTTVDGFMVDVTTYNALPVSQQGVVKSLYDQEFERNEVKRHIRVVPAEFVTGLTQELKRTL
jgi:hypothetical protein